MININVSDIKRHGKTILLGQDRTATEGNESNLQTLRIRENGKEINFYKGSSLGFNQILTDEDKQYLASLGSDK